MDRRRFLQTISSLAGVSIVPTDHTRAQTEPSQPSIETPILEANGWVVADQQPSIPAFSDEEHVENLEKTDWRLNAFYGEELPTQIERSTPFENVSPLQHIWTARVSTTDKNTKRVWTEGESAEFVANIDATTEAAFEHYIEETLVSSKFSDGKEWHRKAVEEAGGFLSGLLPGGLGTAFEIAISWKWDLQSTLSTETGNTASLSQYHYSLPVEAIATNASEHVENEVQLDFRGLYIDWFAEDDVFYAAGGVYPETEKRLNEQLSDAFDSGILDFGVPEFEINTGSSYEQQMLELLAEIE